MASYRNKTDGLWWICYYANGLRKREKIGSSKKAADLAYSRRKLEVAEGKYIDKKVVRKIFFHDLCAEYIERHCKPNKRSWETVDLIHIKKFKNHFGNPPIDIIRQSAIEDYKLSRLDKAHATINRELACLKHIFSKAVEWDYLENNPVKKVKLFKLNNDRCRYLEKDEMQRLLDCSAPHLKPIIVLGISTGMRKGEMLRLKWKDIDFRQGLIHVKITKNGEPRKIPINETAKKVLLSVFRHDDQEYVFCKDDGKPFGNIRKSFDMACKRAGILDFHVHDLRHCFGSYLAMAGVDLYTISQLLGHKSLTMTQRYAHLSDKHKMSAVDKISSATATYTAILTDRDNFDKSVLSVTRSNKSTYSHLPA